MEIKYKNKPILYVDNKISELLDSTQEKSNATERDVRESLRKYPIRDVLIGFSRLSFEIFNSNKMDGRESAFLYIHPTKSVIVTQFALAYLSNVAIMSGSNDYKSEIFDRNDNILGMCQVYNNCIPHAFSEKEVERFGHTLWMIRMHAEQFSYQRIGKDLISRCFILFIEIAPSINPSNLNELNAVHEKQTGLSIEDYLWIAFSTFAVTHKTLTFGVENLIGSNIPKLRSILTKEKVENFFKLMAIDYKEFREIDIEKNKQLNSPYDKTRSNPLIAHPIIHFQFNYLVNPYIITNIITYLRRCFDGLYWWFDSHFEDMDIKDGSKSRGNFRTYFGEIFQEYAGRVLKAIYGKESVMPEFAYGSKKEPRDFSDWWMERGGKLYIFEIKASQLNLKNRQVCDAESFKKEEIPKITKAIKQLFLISRDIKSNKYEKLKRFNGQVVVPVAVFYDMPFVSERALYADWLNDELEKMEKEDSRLAGVCKFTVHLINIDQLELFESMVDEVELEDVFIENNRLSTSSNIVKTMNKLSKGKKVESKFLDDAFERFFRAQGFPDMLDD